ncbi:MAG: putative Ig domain-containing protein [Magnetococcales bacterium]|nr:putative Ig domain-containing protein [Magnetococcales bacterium]
MKRFGSGRRQVARVNALVLEARVVFDGAAVDATATAMDAGRVQEVHRDIAAVDRSALSSLAELLAPAAAEASSAARETSSAPLSRTTQVALVDQGVDHWQDLAAGFGDDVEVHTIDSSQSGLTQAAEILSKFKGLDAIHIVSHGSPGRIVLGSSPIDATVVDANQEIFTTIGSSLNESGDILLYGCDVGKGADGATLVDRLAQATGAEVAASTDATGGAASGGNWVLEQTSGSIDVASLDPGSLYGGLLVNRPPEVVRKVGYYFMDWGGGASWQANSINSSGMSPVFISDPNSAALQSVDVLHVDRAYGDTFEYLSRLGDIGIRVRDGGMSLIVHDRSLNPNLFLPGGLSLTTVYSFGSDITVLLNDSPTYRLTNGPAGVVSNTSMDNGGWSYHGYITSGLPAGAVPVLGTGVSGQIVSFYYKYGSGYVYYSTVPLDYYESSYPGYPYGLNKSIGNTYIANVIELMAEKVTVPVWVNALEDSAFSYQVKPFVDLDVGSSLTITAAQSNGSALPAWLSFDPTTRTFSGTPRNGDVGARTFRVTANDGQGGSVYADYMVVVQNTNDAPTGSVAVSGTASEDSTLSVSNSLGDVDGMGVVSYKWQSSANGTSGWTDIPGATLSSLTLDQQSLVGKYIRAVASYTDSFGAPESVASAATAKVVNVNDAPTGTVTVSGTASEDSTLTVSNSLGDVDGMGVVSYKWQSSENGSSGWTDITGADGYSFLNLDNQTLVGKYIRAVANYTDGFGTFESVASAATTKVANVNDAPTGTVTVSGTVSEDCVLTASNSLGDADGMGTVSYKWQSSANGSSGWTDISGAINSTLRLDQQALLGKSVRAVASYTDGLETLESVASAATAAVGSINDAPTVTGSVVNIRSRPLAGATFSVTADGRYVAFSGVAGDLVPGDTNGVSDVFLRDTLTGAITLVSRSASGTLGNAHSYSPVLSSDGRYVAFTSDASNFAPGDTNGVSDIFLKDTLTGSITLVSGSASGAVGNYQSIRPLISVDGRYVSFASSASNLVSGDTNGVSDVFLKDTVTGSVVLVSSSASGIVGDAQSGVANGQLIRHALSADGRYAAFLSRASNLVPGDTNGTADIFLKDTQTGAITLVSSTASGTAGNSSSDVPVLSPSGRYVAFLSGATNFVSGDTNETHDIFLKDTQTGSLTLVSGTASGTVGNGHSYNSPVVLDGGRYAVTWGYSSNLVPGDTNGVSDVFLKDTVTGSVTLVSSSASGTVGNTYSYNPVLSTDGRYVAFVSWSNNFVPGVGAYGTDGVFLKDTLTGSVTIVSSSAPTGDVSTIQLSSDARIVAFSAGKDVDGWISIVDTRPQLASSQITEGNTYSYTLPANTFSDEDAGDSLSYSASGLPGWLTFNAITRTFSGTPGNGDVGAADVVVTATDLAGASASLSLTLTVQNTNDAPVAAGVTDQNASEDAAFSFQVPTFTDPDVGDTLTYSATCADGSSLPGWLSFNTATRTFSGTPTNGDVGTLSVKVTAMDTSNATASSTFTLTVQNTNDAPTVASITDQNASEDTAFSLQVPAFTDPDVWDTLTYSATRADGSSLPGWLSFNAATRTFSGTPASSDVGTLSLKVTATDTSNATASSLFSLIVDSADRAPEFAKSIAGQSATVGSPFSFQVPADTVVGGAGNALTYTATRADGSPLPAWLSFDPATRTFSGTPTYSSDAGQLSVQLTATDSNGSSVSGNMVLTVVNPGVLVPIQDLSVAFSEAISLKVSNIFQRPASGVTRTYTATLADGTALPWLTFNAATQTFSGKPGVGNLGDLDIRITALDNGVAASSALFQLSATNSAPILAKPVADQTASYLGSVNFRIPADVFVDVDAGDKLTYSFAMADGSAAPAWLSLNATTGTFYSVTAAGVTGDFGIVVTATDSAGLSVSDTFTLSLINSAPVVAVPIGDRTFSHAEKISFKLPDGMFTDADVTGKAGTYVVTANGTLAPSAKGDLLTYTVAMADGSPIPAWLTFNATTRTFSGKPLGVSGDFEIVVTATDKLGASASDTFRLSVTSNGPVLARAIEDRTISHAGSLKFQIPANTFTDADKGDALTYTFGMEDGSATPSWLKFNASTRTFTGKPVGAVGDYRIVVTATDKSMTSVSGAFTLSVTNNGPALNAGVPLVDATATMGSKFTHTFTRDTFVDQDADDVLSYSAFLENGSSLPSWLKFNGTTRTFTGTPPTTTVAGDLLVRVTAKDKAGVSVSSTFKIAVAPRKVASLSGTVGQLAGA